MTNRKSEPLETIEAPDTSEIITFQTSELTAVCPFDFGGPDFYDLTIRYEPDTEIIESKSLKLYLEDFRNREITVEALAAEITGAIRDSVSPGSLYVCLEQARRGGIEETVEVGDVDLR